MLAASAGIGLGYLLRLIIALGKKGSMELDIKQMELKAHEDAQDIVSKAETRAGEIIKKAEDIINEREDRAKKNEDRLIKKEEFLDNRQVEIDKEVEYVKNKVAEIKTIRDKADELIQKKNE